MKGRNYDAPHYVIVFILLLLPLKSKYSPPVSCYEKLQFLSFLSGERPSFTTTQKTGKINVIR
jgi:hypothetical protein